MPPFELKMECDPALVAEVRDRMLAEMKANPDLYHPHDVERVTNDEWMTRRFLLAQKLKKDKAFEMQKEAMKWRKSYGVNDRSDLDFPAEFYKVGALFEYRTDKDNLPVLYFRVKFCKSNSKFNEYVRQWIVNLANNLDLKYGDKGFATVWDLQGAGVSNCDLSLLSFLIKIFFNYFPHPSLYAIAHGIHFLLTPIVKLAIKLLPEDERKRVVIVSNKEELFDHIPVENLPDFMAGTCQEDYHKIPEGAIGVEVLAPTRGIETKAVEQYLKEYKDYL